MYKKKKIGILTLNGYYNYGNRLQNYALEETIRNLGCEVETILVDRSNHAKLSKRIKKISSLRELFGKAYNRLKTYNHRQNKKKRKKVFIDFSNKYIHETNFVLSINNVPKDVLEGYDYFITGSDQVWNPYNLHGTTFFFLTFAPKNKRIAYAPSFGVSEIKPEFVEDYRKWISDMYRLSVREEDGAKIIKELTGREAPVLVDPTLLIDREKWLSISKKASSKPEGKYLLTYFLGGVPTQYKSQIKNIAKEKKLEIISLGDINKKETYSTGPSEFIDYISSCSVMCTDSFHGTVFSILFEKPFIVYERENTSIDMYSRIETLLDMFDLKPREANNIESYEDVFNMDYSHVPSILEVERNKSLAYLREALNIEDGENL